MRVFPHENPFRVSQTDHLSFMHSAIGMEQDALWSKLLGGRAFSIVGGHGCGKTTLLHGLWESAVGRGYRACWVDVKQQGAYRTLTVVVQLMWECRRGGAPWVFLNSGELLPWSLRCSLWCLCRLGWVRAVMTEHRRSFFPVLCVCQPSLCDARQLLAKLGISEDVLPEELATVFERFSGNMRLVFRYYYDVFGECRGSKSPSEGRFLEL